MTKSLTHITLLAILLCCVATFTYANSIDCAVAPSSSSCAPNLTLTYRVGGNAAVSFAPGAPPVFADGMWNANFAPQSSPGVLFMGSEVGSNPYLFVGFSFGVINNSQSLVTFTYDFTTAFGGGPDYSIQSIYGDTLIDTSHVGTSTVAPVGSSFIMNSYVDGVLVAALGRGTGCTTVGFVCESGAVGVVGPMAYLSAAAGTLEVQGSFTLTPGAQFSLTGFTQFLPVPEPGSFALMGTGRSLSAACSGAGSFRHVLIAPYRGRGPVAPPPHSTPAALA